MVHKCAVCPNKFGPLSPFTFHRFPRSAEMCKQWITLCRRDDLVDVDPLLCNLTYKLCSSHFDKSQFVGNRLIPGALPSKFEWSTVVRLEITDPKPLDSLSVVEETESCSPIDWSQIQSTSTPKSNSVAKSLIDKYGSKTITVSSSSSSVQTPEGLSKRIPRKGKLQKLLSTQKGAKKWIENDHLYHLRGIDVSILRSKNYRVCDEHFENEMFLNPLSKKDLKMKAVPTLFNMPVKEEEVKPELEALEPLNSDFTPSLHSTSDEMQLKSVKEEVLPELEVSYSPLQWSRPTTERKAYTIYDYTVRDVLTDHDYIIKTEEPNISSNVLQKTSTFGSCQTSPSHASSFYPPSHVSCQTPLYLSKNSPRKLKLRSEIRSKSYEIYDLQKKLKATTAQLAQFDTHTHMLYLCKQYLPPKLYLIVETYINRCNKKGQGYRYNDEFKELARTLHKLSPKVYTYLRSVLPLPSSRRLYAKLASNELDLSP